MQICLEIAGSYTISKKTFLLIQGDISFLHTKYSGQQENLRRIRQTLDIPWLLERADLTQVGQGISLQPGNKF